jgi:hypothetical protein
MFELAYLVVGAIKYLRASLALGYFFISFLNARALGLGIFLWVF